MQFVFLIQGIHIKTGNSDRSDRRLFATPDDDPSPTAIAPRTNSDPAVVPGSVVTTRARSAGVRVGCDGPRFCYNRQEPTTAIDPRARGPKVRASQDPSS